MQKIVADKTERHFNVKLKDLMKEEEEGSEKEKPSDEEKKEEVSDGKESEQ